MDWEKIVSELDYRTSRSSGAGGQHVNKTETKVELVWNVPESNGLTDDEKEIISSKLIAIINDEGLLRISSQKHRSQLSNKEDVVEKLYARVVKALTPVVKRKRSRPTKASIEERLAEKKIQAEKKEARRKPEL